VEQRETATRVNGIRLALMAAVVAILLVGACPTLRTAVFGISFVSTVLAGQDGELPRKGYLGVRLALLPDEARARDQLGPGAGVLVEAVVPDTAAADGGIRQGDVLLAVAGRAVSGVADVMTTVAAMTASQQFEVTLLRAGRRIVLPMTLKERPRDQGENFDVLYHHVVSGAARIRTIVTRPHAPGRHPVLFLIQGLGPATVDQPLSGPEPYSRILGEFAKSGYVTVRVEKPGIGDSEGGPFDDLDFHTELEAYRRAMIDVRAYSFVDVDKVFIFGHSMGGVFGSIIASEVAIKGIVVYGTVAKTSTEYFLENWRRQATLAGNDPEYIDSMLRDLAAVLHYLVGRCPSGRSSPPRTCPDTGRRGVPTCWPSGAGTTSSRPKPIIPSSRRSSTRRDPARARTSRSKAPITAFGRRHQSKTVSRAGTRPVANSTRKSPPR